MDRGVFIPAEWAPHRAIWTAWPSAAHLWLENLEPARAEVAAMVKALSGGDRMRVLAHGEEAVASAKAAIGDVAEIIPAAFGDIWLRDTGPIFARVRTANGEEPAAIGFKFNGWGGKYELPHDDEVAGFIAREAGTPLKQNSFILEGGAIEMDGEGTVLTTRQCLLNANRNAGWKDHTAEAKLAGALGVRRVLWIDEGLHNDHTDGHIDNLARFVGSGRVVCQAPSGPTDPNAKILDAIARQLETMVDAEARPLEVIRIPSPGLVVDDGGLPVPASHMNFIIGDEAVVVPIYTGTGDDAVNALAPLFPTRKVVGLSANAILSGGGAFHCITQQEPV